MRIELFGKDIGVLTRWERALKAYGPRIVDGILPDGHEKVVVADFASAPKEILEYLKKRDASDGIRLVALEGAPDADRARRLLAAGVKGYGNSYMQPVHLRSCVETVASGHVWLYPELVHALVGELACAGADYAAEKLPESLTPREKELAALILEGKSNREIAEALGITERTVKAHLGRIYEKLHVSNRLELALRLKETETSTS
jgi:DNA-binding NarL/FixJ family response regulator